MMKNKFMHFAGKTLMQKPAGLSAVHNSLIELKYKLIGGQPGYLSIPCFYDCPRTILQLCKVNRIKMAVQSGELTDQGHGHPGP